MDIERINAIQPPPNLENETEIQQENIETVEQQEQITDDTERVVDIFA